MFIQLTVEDQATQIKHSREKVVAVFFVRLRSFYWDSLLQSKYIILDIFHRAEIVILGAIQFQKMLI